MNRTASKIVDCVLIVAVLITAGIALESRFGTHKMTDYGQPGVLKVADWRVKPGYDRMIGPANALKEMVVWSDYECPACRTFDSQMRGILARPNNDVRFVLKHFPMANHLHAMMAAETAECAQRAGIGESVHRALFDVDWQTGSFPMDSVLKTVPTLAATQIRECVTSHLARPIVLSDLDEGTALGLKGTPSLQIGPKVITGVVPPDQLLELLESRTARARNAASVR